MYNSCTICIQFTHGDLHVIHISQIKFVLSEFCSHSLCQEFGGRLCFFVEMKAGKNLTIWMVSAFGSWSFLKYCHWPLILGMNKTLPISNCLNAKPEIPTNPELSFERNKKWNPCLLVKTNKKYFFFFEKLLFSNLFQYVTTLQYTVHYIHTIGLTLWNLSSFEFKFDDTKLSS